MDTAEWWKVVWSKAAASKHSLILDGLQFRVELYKKHECLNKWYPNTL